MIALKIDATFEEKLTFAFKNDMRNGANFRGLKFHFKSKMVELNQSKNSRQPDQPDAM